MLDGRRIEVRNFDRRLQGLLHRCKEDHCEAAPGRTPDHPDDRRNDAGERALAAGDDLGQISGSAQSPVEAIARPTLDQPDWQATGNLLCIRCKQTIGSVADFGQALLAHPHPGDGAVRHDHLERREVVGRGAVNGGVGARGVVGDHAAESRPRRSRDVGPEPQAVGSEERVEVVEDHPGADLDGSGLEVEVRDTAVVAREVDHQPAAESATRETGARPPRRDLDAAAGGG